MVWLVAKSHVDSSQRLVVRRDVGHGTRALMGVASGGWREVRLDKGVSGLVWGKDVSPIMAISNNTRCLPIPLGVDLV
jgi:hypothetical protein